MSIYFVHWVGGRRCRRCMKVLWWKIIFIGLGYLLQIVDCEITCSKIYFMFVDVLIIPINFFIACVCVCSYLFFIFYYYIFTIAINFLLSLVLLFINVYVFLLLRVAYLSILFYNCVLEFLLILTILSFYIS